MAAIDAAQANLIVPVLVGPEEKIRAVAAQEDIDLAPYTIVPTEHSHAAADTAVAMARAGEVEALMKGSLQTSELISAAIARDVGIRTDRRMSHVSVMAVPSYPRPLFLTDTGINIAPDLGAKRDIIQNAIDLAYAVGIEQPKVAVLAALETVNAKMSATLDAAALAKMAERGQISGGIVDGPLAFDNAVSSDAARLKHITSPVAGQADILVMPDIETASMLAKQLGYLAGAQGAGIVLGSRVPIILPSRADTVLTRMASCALAVAVAHRRRSSMPL
jgi:phosphate acetyltransferase/phosphate butyryltransferase